MLGLHRREVGEMDVFFRLPRHVAPDFVRGERQDRRHQFDQRLQDLVHGGLGAAPFPRLGFTGIDAVLQDIQVEGAHFYGTERIDRVIEDMEFAGVVSLQHLFLQQFQLVQSPAVDFGHVPVGNGIPDRVKIADAPQDVPAGIADPAVRFGQAGQDLLGNTDIVPVVLGRHPEAEDLGAVLLDDLFRGDHVPHRLAHLPSGAVHHEAVGEDVPVGCNAAGAHRGEERGVEPAAVLVAPLQVHVGRGAKVGAALQHGGMGDAGVEPDVEDVHLLVEVALAARGADRLLGEETRRFPVVPDIGAVLLEELRHVEHHRGLRQDLAAALAIEGGNRHTPAALAGDAPVGAVLDHAEYAFFSPFGDPLHGIDLFQGLDPQVVALHGDEPLLGCTEDDRFLATPAVGIGVGDLPRGHQRADLFQLFDHSGIGVEYELAAEELHVLEKTAAVVDRI